jgi:hypothetical protein
MLKLAIFSSKPFIYKIFYSLRKCFANHKPTLCFLISKYSSFILVPRSYFLARTKIIIEFSMKMRVKHLLH